MSSRGIREQKVEPLTCGFLSKSISIAKFLTCWVRNSSSGEVALNEQVNEQTYFGCKLIKIGDDFSWSTDRSNTMFIRSFLLMI